MNIIDIIDNNSFLKTIYPDGLNNFFLGRVELTSFDRISFVLHQQEPPKTTIPKWGQWGKDYNIVTVELLAGGIQKLNVNNWQKNHEQKCITTISKQENGAFLMRFSGEGWFIEIILTLMVFQRNTTYLLDDNN